MVCKLSIVIPGSQHAGAIIDTPAVPNVGDHLALGDSVVEVLEVMDLLPPRGDFWFIHATCKLVGEPGPHPADPKGLKDP
jgi:hypothetical protein